MDSLDRSPVFVLADAFVDDAAALDPAWATDAGVSGYDDQLTDYSPDGIEARAALCRQTLVELAGLSTPDRLEELAASLLIERLDTQLALIDADEPLCDLNNIASPVQVIREVFDLMAYDTVDDWEVAGRRLAAVPEAVAGAVAAYEEGRRRGLIAARRQALEAAGQAAAWAGDGPDDPFFDDLVSQADTVSGVTPALQAELVGVGRRRHRGLRRVWPTTCVAPTRPTPPSPMPSVPTATQTLARSFLGAEIDLTEAYEWAWEELARIETDMARECERLRPGAGDRRDGRLARAPRATWPSRGPTPCANGSRTSWTRPCPTWTAPTSTSPRRCAGSRP